MALQTPILTDFTAGELSRRMAGRIDLSAYYKGLSILDNWTPFSQGGITYRSGTEYLGPLKQGAGKARLIPFTIDEDTAYILEIGAGYIRFWKDGFQITSGSVPMELTCPYTESHVGELQYAQAFKTLILAHQSYPLYELSWNGGNSFTFSQMPVTGNVGRVPFGSADNYPGCIAFFHGRLFLARSIREPQKIWASRPFKYGDFTYFDTVMYTTRALKDPATWTDPQIPEYEDVTTSQDVIGDDNAIEIEIGSDQNDRIHWLATGNHLIVGTSTSEWIVGGDITALNQYAKLQTRYGSAGIQARMVGDSILFVQGSRTKLREYYYTTEQASYQSPDLTRFADHMLVPQVMDFDFSQTPEPVVYCTLENGTVAALLFDRSQGVQAWYRITPGDGRKIESVAVAPGTDGDYVYLSVCSTSSGSAVRTLEILGPTFSDSHLDGAVTRTASNGYVQNLEWLSGHAVRYTDGTNWYSGIVTSGALALNSAIPNGRAVTVGIGYTGTLRTMHIHVQTPQGTGATKVVAIATVSFRLLESYPFKVGPSTAAASLETAILPSGTPFTGDIQVPFRGDWDRESWIVVLQDQPVSTTILAIVPEVNA